MGPRSPEKGVGWGPPWAPLRVAGALHGCHADRFGGSEGPRDGRWSDALCATTRCDAAAALSGFSPVSPLGDGRWMGTGGASVMRVAPGAAVSLRLVAPECSASSCSELACSGSAFQGCGCRSVPGNGAPCAQTPTCGACVATEKMSACSSRAILAGVQPVKHSSVWKFRRWRVTPVGLWPAVALLTLHS